MIKKQIDSWADLNGFELGVYTILVDEHQWELSIDIGDDSTPVIIDYSQIPDKAVIGLLSGLGLEVTLNIIH